MPDPQSRPDPAQQQTNALTPEERAELDLALDEERAGPVLPDTARQAATDIETRTGLLGPANWWRLGLAALVLLAIVLFALQWPHGGSRTDVSPGAPTTPPGTQSK
jgi:hypothetical protein